MLFVSDLLKKLQNDGKKPKGVSLKMGSYKFRLLPHIKDVNKFPYQKVEIHYINHPKTGIINPFKCLIEDCGFCKLHERQKEAGNPHAWKTKKNIVYLYYALNEKKEFIVLILKEKEHNAVRNEIVAWLKAKENPLDLTSGKFINIAIGKVGNRNKIIAKVLSDICSLDHTEREIFYNLPPLESYYKDYTRDELRELFNKGIKKPVLKREEAPSKAGGKKSSGDIKKQEFKKEDIKKKPEVKEEKDDDDIINRAMIFFSEEED